MKLWKLGKDDDFDGRPDKLRDLLFNAVAQGNSSQFVKLCQNNKDLIFKHFPTWQKVPEHLRKNPAQVQWYSRGVISVANYFAQNGDARLIQMLTGPAETNPIDRWAEEFRQAQALLSEERDDEGVRVLEKLLRDILKHQGSAVDQYIPKILGLLGIGYFRQGQTEKALKATQQAYDLCKKSGDTEGASAYHANLAEMRRQLGNSDEVDETAIIFRDNQGRILRYKDLKGFTGSVRWEIVGKENVPPQAEKLHQAGRQAGQQGEYEKALELFLQAAQLAPRWPYPVYDAAFTYLLNDDFDRALEYYEKVDELAPRGFFTSKTAVHTLRQEKNDRLPQGIYSFHMSLEWEPDPRQKKQIIDQLLQGCPDFAPAWKEKINFAESDEERLKFIARGLECNPDADTQGMLLINKAAILNRQGKRQEAIEILAGVALDPDVTLQNEHLAKSFLVDLL